MFDIGFWELCLIATVALLVLGPERLPVAARTAGKWVGKIRSMVTNVKSEIDRELKLDEIRRNMELQEQKLREQTGIDDFKDAVDQTIADLKPVERTSHSDQPSPDDDNVSESDPSPSDKSEKHGETKHRDPR